MDEEGLSPSDHGLCDMLSRMQSLPPHPRGEAWDTFLADLEQRICSLYLRSAAFFSLRGKLTGGEPDRLLLLCKLSRVRCAQESLAHDFTLFRLLVLDLLNEVEEKSTQQSNGRESMSP